PLPQPTGIPQPQRHQLLIAVQQDRHATLRNVHATPAQDRVDLGHTALLTRPQLADEGDDVEAEFALRQRPGPRFLRDIRAMILRARRIDTLPHPDGQAPESIEAHDRAMVMVGHPQPLPAGTTLLTHRRQHLLVRGRWSAPSASHRPPLPLLRLHRTCCLSLVYSCPSSGLYRRRKKDTGGRAVGDEEARAAWREAAAQLDPEHLVFVDESGTTIALTRVSGWAPHERRATGSVPRHHGKHTTLVAALAPDGL